MFSKSSRRRRVRGYMLIDAMVACTVGTAVMVSTYTLVATAAGASQAARQNTASAAAARQVIENLRSLKSTPAAVGTYTDVTIFGPVPQLALLDGGAATLTVSAYSTHVEQATVTVTWRAGRTNTAKSCTFTTLMTTGGVAP